MQHALLENSAHYIDFPFNRINAVQNVSLPSDVPAANAFYQGNAYLRGLQRGYIRKVLDTVGENDNVVHLTSEEYTGSTGFIYFWLDVVKEWEQENHKRIRIGISATKDVLDSVLASREDEIDTIDLRYFWYLSDGQLYAPGRTAKGRPLCPRYRIEPTPPQNKYTVKFGSIGTNTPSSGFFISIGRIDSNPSLFSWRAVPF